MKKTTLLINIIHKNIIFLLMILITLTSIFLFWLQQEENDQNQTKPEYHFYMIAQNSVDPFWKEIREGVEAAAEVNNVAVEFNAPRFNSPQEEIRYLDIAILSKVDGIITHVSQGWDFTSLINEAYENGIPVITIENDDKESNRNAFVGSNSFQLGKMAGNLMIEATGGNAKIGIIVNNDVELDIVTHDLKINGFLSSIKDYPNMEVVKVYTSRMGIISAEEITDSIINGGNDISAIFTTSSVDTIGAAQLIVDHNKVGKISLVGYGDTEDIIRYIKKGIVYGTVMSDPYKMGYESLNALLSLKENSNVSTFIDTGVKVITPENLDDYENDKVTNEIKE